MFAAFVRKYASRSMCISAIVMAMMFESCGPQMSVYPLFDRQDVVTDPTIEGHWTTKIDGDSPVHWQVMLRKDDAYEFRESEGAFVGHLFRLGGDRFFDFLNPDKDIKGAHFFCRLDESQADELQISCLNEHVLDSEDDEQLTIQGVLIPETGDLRTLVTRHQNDPKAFEAPIIFTRVGDLEVKSYEDQQKEEAEQYLAHLGKNLRAAQQGDAVAQEALGLTFAMSKDAKDWQRSRYWYWRAAQQGRASAQYALAKSYDGNHADLLAMRKALYWYRQAAAAGQADSQFRMGELYEQGELVGESWSQAEVWYRKAAEQNQPKALYALAHLLNYSDFVEDEREAIELYERYLALNPKDAQAWNELLLIYQFADDRSLRDPAAVLRVAASYRDAAPEDFKRWSSTHSLLGMLPDPPVRELPSDERGYVNFTFDGAAAPDGTP
ncbi:MAG: tetratricopeptide repeat protein [Terriglobales bacterium]